MELRTGCTSKFQCSACRSPLDSPQYLAHRAVATAIAAGQLARPADFPCADCAGPAIEYDHRDYSKPLQVEPVCRRCNLLRGPALGSPALAKEA